MNLVYRHKSGGELWQGSKDDVHLLASRPDNRIRTIALCAMEFQPDIRSGRYEVLKHGFDDNSWMREAEAQRVAALADKISTKLARRIRGGHGVLSSCYAGWNRSGLVSALTVMKVADLGPHEAIRLVREARGPDALGNSLFVKMIHWMKDKQGVLATWTQWQHVGEGLLSKSVMVEMTFDEIRRSLAALSRRELGLPPTKPDA